MELRNVSILLFAAGVVCTGACRRQVTVTPGSPNSTVTNSATPQYHQDAGVTLAVPQTKFFKGSIGGRLGLQMKLTRDGDNVAGEYFYQNVGTKIAIKGAVDKDNNLTLEEFDNSGKQTGLFKGNWTADADGLISLAGNWSKPGSDKKTAFSLHEEPIQFTKPIELTARQIKETNKKSNYEIDAEYPQATGVTDAGFEKFNQEAKNLVSRRVAEFKKQTADTSLDSAASSPSPEEKSETSGSSLDVSYNVALAKDDLISVKFEVGSYSAGAAHPNSASAVLNYDVKNGKVLRLGDLFLPGARYLQAISSYCIKDLKRQSKSKGALLEDAMIESGAGADAKNYQSWTITKKGLEITFDAYQVGSYAAGPQIVVVPYSALKEMIRIDGPVMQFVK